MTAVRTVHDGEKNCKAWRPLPDRRVSGTIMVVDLDDDQIPMLLTTHAAAGILIGHSINNPYAVFGLSFVSHFVLDFIPHGDENLSHDYEWKVEKRYRRAILINLVDLAALGAVSIWAFQHPGLAASRLMVIGILGGILPDFISHLFPVIHERLSWLALIRWIYRFTKPTGLRYVAKAQDWLHQQLHHEIIRRDVPFPVGLAMQIILVFVFLSLAR